MKKILVIIISLFLFSCSNSTIKTDDVKNLSIIHENNNNTDKINSDDSSAVPDHSSVDNQITCVASKHNWANYGIATYYDDTLIYTDFKIQKLVKVNKNDNEVIVLSDRPYFDLYVYKDWIYGRAFDDNGLFYLHRVKIDGTIEERIVEWGVNSFQIVNDKLVYCLTNSAIYEQSLKSGENLLIVETEIPNLQIYVEADWIYYHNFEDNKLVQLNRNNGEVETLFQEELIMFIVESEKIFYSTGSGIFMFNMNEENHSLVVEGKIDSFNLLEDELYYVDYNKNLLYKYNMITRVSQILYEGDVLKINLVCNKVIFGSFDSERNYITKIINVTE